MEDRRTPMDQGAAEGRFAEMLDEAGLPRFASTFHDAALDELRFTWDHGLTIHMDLTRPDVSPIDDWERAAIVGQAQGCEDHEPVHVFAPGSADEDPRIATSTLGVVIHRGPPLHPDDVTTHNGISVRSPSRTLIDCAEFMTAAELRAAFARPQEIACSTPKRFAQRARAEWRPSLAMLDEVIDEFCG